MSQPGLSVVKCDHIIHTGIVNTHATDTIEVHGFRQRLQDSLLHMLSVSDPWVVSTCANTGAVPIYWVRRVGGLLRGR